MKFKFIDFLLFVLISLVSLFFFLLLGGKIYPFSIEGSLLTQIDFVSNHWNNDFWWHRQWFLGYPTFFWNNPFFVIPLGLFSMIFSLEVYIVYRWLVFFSVLVLPIFLFFLFRQLNFSFKGFVVGLVWFFLGLSPLYFLRGVHEYIQELQFMPFVFWATFVLGWGSKIWSLLWGFLSLFCFFSFLKKDNLCRWRLLGSVFFGVLCLLTDSSSFVFLLSCWFSCLLSLWAKVEVKSKILSRFSLALLFLFGLICFWYSPCYWWHLFWGTSLAGKSFVSIFFFVFRFLVILGSLILGVWTAFRRFSRSQDVFILTYLFLIIFFTLTRFIADSDFWQDFSVYGVELDLGLCLFFALAVERINPKKTALYLLVSFFILSRLIFFIVEDQWQKIGTEFDSSFEKRISSQLERLMAEDDCVFVSGSLVSWLNYFSPKVSQVRGGQETASVNSVWRRCAYEIRQGTDIDRTKECLNLMQVDFIVVHDPLFSADPYDDFVYSGKFENDPDLFLVFNEAGDYIYQFDDSSENCLSSDFREEFEYVDFGENIDCPVMGRDFFKSEYTFSLFDRIIGSLLSFFSFLLCLFPHKLNDWLGMKLLFFDTGIMEEDY